MLTLNDGFMTFQQLVAVTKEMSTEKLLKLQEQLDFDVQLLQFIKSGPQREIDTVFAHWEAVSCTLYFREKRDEYTKKLVTEEDRARLNAWFNWCMRQNRRRQERKERGIEKAKLTRVLKKQTNA